MTAKVYATGKTHNIGGRNGSTRSSDGKLDIKLASPHPEAENFFGAAWSACFLAALQLVAAQRKVSYPAEPTIDATINLNVDDGSFFLSAVLDVAVPGLDRTLARELVDAAHAICPYSKMAEAGIDVAVNLV